MKIERLNENQIRCTLNKEDLADRKLMLTELAYGTPKARELFQEMMMQASIEVGFEADNIPLMVEAIPVHPDSLVLVITKVEDPEELDTRFSKFTQTPTSDTQADDEAVVSNHIQKSLLGAELEELFKKATELSQANTNKELKEPVEKGDSNHIYAIFSFRDYETIEQAAKVIDSFYHGENALYQDPASDFYYLVIYMNGSTVAEFQRAQNTLFDFAQFEHMAPVRIAFFKEHYRVLFKKEAIHQIVVNDQSH
ncbi:MAG: adaptor protein MecA [Lachnospiraceae bacterium]